MTRKSGHYLDLLSQGVAVVSRGTIVGNPHTRINLIDETYYNTSYISRNSAISFFSLAFNSLIFYN